MTTVAWLKKRVLQVKAMICMGALFFNVTGSSSILLKIRSFPLWSKLKLS